ASDSEAPVKRKAFFSFHFDDVMRVNVVRNAWKITHPDSALMRSFSDSSLWESRKREGPESLKQLIRDGVKHTSTICVLVGVETWSRRWVRYEIARGVIDSRGLLAVHINSINHHQTRTPHARGPNPLAYMSVGKVQSSPFSLPVYYLFERTSQGWDRYQDHTTAISLPPWLADPAPGYVTPLSYCADEYDYIPHDGHKNIGAWIDRAAQKAGR
ncbi:MAG: TIR domain-containing protein, partial [Beijerinckiaceae bacterium]